MAFSFEEMEDDLAIESCLKKCFVLLVGLLIFVLSAPGPAAAADDRIKEIRIADGKGDYGYPNPYRHYPRGPGYVRMLWVFETLIWKDDKGYIPALAQKWSYDPEAMAFTFDLAGASNGTTAMISRRTMWFSPWSIF